MTQWTRHYSPSEPTSRRRARREGFLAPSLAGVVDRRKPRPYWVGFGNAAQIASGGATGLPEFMAYQGGSAFQTPHSALLAAFAWLRSPG